MFEALAAAIDRAEVPLEAPALTDALRLADQFSAKVSVAVGEFDARGLWRPAAVDSMMAWLRHYGRMVDADADRMVAVAQRLRDFPLTRQAWADGVLSGGQVRTILANVTEATAGLYAAQETEIVPMLIGLGMGGTTAVMRTWAARAEVLAQPGEPDDPESPDG